MKSNLLKFSIDKMKEHISFANKMYKEEMDRKTKNAVVMECFQAINYALDFMEEFIKENELGNAFSYMDYVDILEENGLINREKAKQIRYLIVLRNKVAHEYHIIEEEEIKEMVKRINHLKVLEKLLNNF